MDHLRFTKVELPVNERRKRTGFGTKIRKNHAEQGEYLISQVNSEMAENLSLASKRRFSPYLLVKVELEKEANLTEDNIHKLESMGLRVVDMEAKDLMVLFAEDIQLQEFKQALENYKNGVIAITNVQNEDLFGLIKSISRWGKEDRKGQDLDKLLAEDYIDCYLWIFDSLEETKEKVDEFIDDIRDQCIKYCDRYVSQSVAIVRIKVKRNAIDYFLEHPLVYRIDRIPNYQMKRIERETISSVSLNDITYTCDNLGEDSVSICIIDSGILSGHPLIKDCVGDAKTFYLTDDYTNNENDIDGHGTMVAGICEYGEIKVDKVFAPSIRLFSAKIHDGMYIGDFQLCLSELKAEKFGLDFEQEDLVCQFFSGEIDMDTLMDSIRLERRKFEFKNIVEKYIDIYEKLRPNQMREIVEYFFHTYNCRIFNLSQGNLNEPYSDGKPRAWTCVLDELQREYNVLFIISSGNGSCEGMSEYPYYFYKGNNLRIIDPAASISSITVGGLAVSSTAYVPRDEQIVFQHLSLCNEISSITRVGPGIGKSIKPDFVAYSGDYGINTLTNRASRNIGFQVLSLSNKLTEGLFTYDMGTSFAAPYVSHIAAEVLERYKNCSNNLIRALLVSTARIENSLIAQSDKIATHVEILPEVDTNYKQNVKGDISYNKQKLLHYTAGYGMPVEECATDSSENRVVLYADMFGTNAIEVEKTHIFEIPIPEIFTRAHGKKRIIVSLAFNPEVRNTRLDYMGTSMSFELIRGKSLDEVYSVCASQAGKQKEEKEERFPDKFRCKMNDAGKTLREKGTLQRGIFEFSRSDYGDNYYIVVDCKKNWSTESQDYALVVTYETDDNIELYNVISERVRIRRRERV